jgi:hypothetical protein
LKAELPIGDMVGGIYRWGANEATFTLSWLMSAGLNWHLFDTIDIVKYNTGIRFIFQLKLSTIEK